MTKGRDAPRGELRLVWPHEADGNVRFPPDEAGGAVVRDQLEVHQQKKAGLAEIHRVLKPGGRFLMVVWVPGWATFSLANLFCLFLTSKAGWRTLARAVGFVIRDEGTFNGMWFAVLERPR